MEGKKRQPTELGLTFPYEYSEKIEKKSEKSILGKVTHLLSESQSGGFDLKTLLENDSKFKDFSIVLFLLYFTMKSIRSLKGSLALERILCLIRNGRFFFEELVWVVKI